MSIPRDSTGGPPCGAWGASLSSAASSPDSPPIVPRAALAPPLRLAVAALGLGLGLLLVVAAYLTPNPSGHGTHQQLGLPPCTFLIVFRHRCPACGMTTAWSHVVRGQVLPAVRSNVAGAATAVAALAAAPWLLACAVAGRWLGFVPHERGMMWAGWTVAGVAIVDWALRGYWS